MLKPEDLSPTDEELLSLLKDGRVTAPYAAEELDYSKQHIRDRLRRLVEHEHVAKVHEGLYELVSDPRLPLSPYEESASVVEKALWEIKHEVRMPEPDWSHIEALATRGLGSLDEILETAFETGIREEESNDG